jgi:Trk K+ transport system NAD-binding subunit
VDRPVILCGFGRVGRRILDHLVAAGQPVAVVSLKPPPRPLPPGATFVRGDCCLPETLEAAGVGSARGVIVVTDDDLVNVNCALLVRRLNPDVRVVVRMFNQTLIPRLGAAVRNVTALSVSALTAPLIALTALTGDARGAFDLDGKPQLVAEVIVADGSPLAGRRLGEAAAAHRLLVLSRGRGRDEPDLWPALDPDARLAAGDAVVACGSPDDLAPLLAGDRDGPLGRVRWAGWVRRQFRTLGRTLGAIEWPVTAASVGLFVTLFASTLVFRFGVGEGWADSLYRTVSVVATGSDLQGQRLPEWAKVFVSVLKIAGAALVAGFTAIFTQYLLRAKLGGALEAGRIPDGGHVVVCGLGNVGFRCVEELHRLGQSVAAIELVADSPFAATVRRMGVPVIVGDATVSTVLDQARAGTARAVIAATESELSNLEIGLLVRERNPAQRVVVRLTEPAFAEAVRAAADIKLAVSVPALAAPAFAAALFGDRVQTLLTVGSRTLAVVELVVQPDDGTLADRPLAAAAAEYRFRPVGMGGRPPFACGEPPDGLRLQPGDRLTAVIAVPDLERLLRREPVPV